MKKKVAVIHTFLYSVEDLKKLFREKLPDVEMINIVDDSLLEEALANKGLTPGIVKRICQYATTAQEMDADLILNQCSSVGEAADVAQKLIDIPYIKIDQPMAAKAVELGTNIAVIATAISTLEPSSRLVESNAAKMDKKVNVNRFFADGAYEALLVENDREKHNRIVIDTVKVAATTNDVIVLAQGSMYKLMPLLADIEIPVLTSLETGVEQIKKYLDI
ncbi:aspartate/glutamate racemase family protein [Alkalibacter mobilis]|uniref:aspartate/glutamate racemase family protein n=1 Tax=Alkalibacter mobilis TaxID=2787712 RepID=UPI00189F487F|nr:aspartate/glutamate racemase family protein [Alkalibacter mobilis]MBF7096741.1 Asp/Glu/hydantoin racemase [Alkalibacter mobilis]